MENMMKKKSIIFLINGLGIEKPGSYSISIDQTMPKLARTKETSFFTTAITSSLEPTGAYLRFFMGNTHSYELEYINNNILNENLNSNPTYNKFISSITRPQSKIHVFVEPTNDRIVNEVNALINTLTLEKDKPVYLHLILPQLTVNDYKRLKEMVNYIKYHINDHITVGFVMGKEFISDKLTKEEMDYTKKMFFYCSCERWTETDSKLDTLRDTNVLPCKAPGFTATNDCTISNGDTILFFNTQRTNYDKIIDSIYLNASSVFKEEVNLPIYSMIKLYSKYEIDSFAETIEYKNSLANILKRVNKQALIITDKKNMDLINFDANGLNTVINPQISYMEHNDSLYDKEYIRSLLDNSNYDLFIFDYYMDISSTINNLKDKLSQIDVIIGNLAEASENRHSLFITSLYGVKKTMKIADYNDEEVTIDYEMEIPIFFYDYTYPRSKYTLSPGETNNILYSAIKCIAEDNEIDSLIRPKGIINNLFGVKK